MKNQKQVFGYFEIAFDAIYLCAMFTTGLYSLLKAQSKPQLLVGIMTLVLAGGDAFHLLPRMLAVLTQKEEALRAALGFGKLVASISMTIFYVLLWQIGRLLFLPESTALWAGIIYALAALRVLLSLLPQNRWADRSPPANWGLYRNLPFFLLGAVVAAFFWLHRSALPSLYWMWLSIVLSFAFYLPVVLWVNRLPKLGMLMFPKTCAYVWMILMCLPL